jgi:hypothetical protein
VFREWLLRACGNSRTAQHLSFAFPYQFTHALPSGWTVSEVTGEFVNGRLTSVQTNFAPKGAPNTKDPLNVQAFSADNTADCAGFAFSATTFATYNGLTWAIQADHSGAVACAGARMTKKSSGSVGGLDDQPAGRVGATGEQRGGGRDAGKLPAAAVLCSHLLWADLA